MICRTPFHTSISLLCHLFINVLRCKFQKKALFIVAHWFLNSLLKQDNLTFLHIEIFGKCKTNPLEAVLNSFWSSQSFWCSFLFSLFFLTENFTIKNITNFVYFRTLFLKQQTCFAFREKGRILGLKHQYTMDGSKSYLVLLTWYLFFMIQQGLVLSFWNTEVFVLPLKMEKTFLSNVAGLRHK